nr:hypothetical protein [uncultured Bdellovibrio sp.]
MKFLTSLLLILISVVAFARSGDGPTVPWPTSIDRESIFTEDLQGEWVAYGHNSVWYINIDQKDMEPERSSIQIQSAALFTRKASGWFLSADRIFYGKLKMDENHETAFVIFRDYEGTKLRIATGSHRFLDLKLYRTK